MASNLNPATNMQPATPIDPSPSSSSTEGWTVSPVWSTGNDSDASLAFAKGLQDILNRTKTYPILSDVLYQPIVAVLAAIWSFALWRKTRPDGTGIGWIDAIAFCTLPACVYFRWMVAAIGLTGAYVAWSELADGMGDSAAGSGNKLPSFEAFVASLRPAARRESKASNNDSVTAEPRAVSQASPNSEAATLARFETALGLPEKHPESECVVCWSSDQAPLQLPCSHLVCESCLHRLAEASRFLCPFCRRALYSLHNNKIHLSQAITASAGAQLALALVLATLKIAGRRYWGAAGTLFFNTVHTGLLLHAQRQAARLRGTDLEGYFASVNVKFMALSLALSLYNVKANVGSFDEVDWATFIDGVWQRKTNVDEWREVRQVVCWIVPGLAERVLRC